MSREFTYEPVGNNMYVVTTEIEGNNESFHCVVANDETELAELLELAIASKYGPPVEYVLNYAQQRAAAYPSIVDQLDLLYHTGYEGWRSAIQAIKDIYPKE
jgi:hypothetical protein